MTDQLDMNRIPQHIAIIMDGNGRWATERGLDRTFGHKAGLDTVKKITAECARLGVKYLTLYTFSTENWNRPAYEIEALMGLVLSFIEMELFTDNNVKFQMVGDIERLPKSVQDKIHYMEECRAAGCPAGCHLRRIVGIGFHIGKKPLPEPDTFSVFQINCRIQLHDDTSFTAGLPPPAPGASGSYPRSVRSPVSWKLCSPLPVQKDHRPLPGP